MSSLRVCLLNSYYAPDNVGGAERSVQLLAEGLTRLGHEVTVTCLGRTRSTESAAGVTIERLPLLNQYHPLETRTPNPLRKAVWHSRDTFNTGMAQQVGGLLRRLRPDVLHTNTLQGFSVAVWGVARRLGIPVVHTLRDYYLQCPNTAMFRGGRACATACMPCRISSVPRRHASSSVQSVVGVSQFILDHHLRRGYFADAQHEVIYNGCSVAEAACEQPPRSRFTVGFIGRLAPAKGIEGLIAAVKQLVNQGVSVKLLVAGEGEQGYVQSLRAAAAGAPVDFAGYLPPAEFFRQVHYTVVPSEWNEPFARVVIESFAHGVPVLASSAGGLPEAMTGRETGFMFHPANIADLVQCLLQAVETLSSDGYAAMRHACREQSQKFEPEQVTRKYAEIYRNVCSASGAGAMAGVPG